MLSSIHFDNEEEHDTFFVQRCLEEIDNEHEMTSAGPVGAHRSQARRGQEGSGME